MSIALKPMLLEILPAMFMFLLLSLHVMTMIVAPEYGWLVAGLWQDQGKSAAGGTGQPSGMFDAGEPWYPCGQ
jgi:hypothetical protein